MLLVYESLLHVGKESKVDISKNKGFVKVSAGGDHFSVNIILTCETSLLVAALHRNYWQIAIKLCKEHFNFQC